MFTFKELATEYLSFLLENDSFIELMKSIN